MFLYLDFLQHMLFRAADIRIRKLKWRGLWMTKQIEGTVDDDVAVKLAIGEGAASRSRTREIGVASVK